MCVFISERVSVCVFNTYFGFATSMYVQYLFCVTCIVKPNTCCAPVHTYIMLCDTSNMDLHTYVLLTLFRWCMSCLLRRSGYSSATGAQGIHLSSALPRSMVT